MKKASAGGSPPGQDATGERKYLLYALFLTLLVWTLAFENRLTFPFPWNDEARFYLPALSCAKLGSLRPLIVNAPDGLYWTPDGFYIWIALFLKVFGYSIFVARTVCQICIALSVFFLAITLRKICISYRVGAAAATILMAPPVIFAANMVRMESIVCLLFSIAMWLHTRRSYGAAATFLLLSLLIHPALGLALIGYVLATIYVRFRDGHSCPWNLWQTKTEQAFLACTLLLVGLEAIRIGLHFELFRQHMLYQAARKASMSHWHLWIKPQGLILIVILFFLLVSASLVRLRMRLLNLQVLPIAIAALGMQLYAVLGGEGMYDVFSLSVSPAIFIAICYRINAVEILGM